MTIRRWTLALAACALVALPATAHAGPPGTWTKITGIEVPAHNTDELGIERTADGVLHVVYVVQPGGGAPIGDESLMHRAIAKDAKSVAGPDTVATLDSMNNRVDLLPGPGGGLRALFAGLTGTPTSDGFLRTATSDGTGKAWSPAAPASFAGDGTSKEAYVGSGISGVLAADGTPVSIWGDSSPSGGGMHVGLDASISDQKLDDSCCQIDPGLARDGATGAVYAAWNCLCDPQNRLQIQPLGGGVMSASTSSALQTGDRVAITGRLGGKPGIYVAYTAGTNQFLATPALYRVGDAAGKVIKGQKRGQNIGIAPTSDGRLWIFWTRDGKVVATRTNPDATKFGALVSIKPPKGGDTVFRLAGDGTLGSLDLLGLFEKGGSDLGYWHQRIRAGLTLTATPAKVNDGGKVTFKVTDAGAAISGAKVKLKLGSTTKSGTTDSNGKVKLTVPTGTTAKSYTATASKAGYADGTAKVKVK